MSRAVKHIVQKVEVKQTLEENLRQGIEIAGVLVDASKETPMDLDDSSENEINHKPIEDDEEDTLEEAPSIVDEALGKETSLPSSSRSSTGGSSSSAGSSKNWNKADNVRATVGVDQKLKDALYEGQEVGQILIDAKVHDEQQEQQRVSPPLKRKPLSHFRAMALVGKLFFDFKKIKTMNPVPEVHPEVDADTSSQSKEGSYTDESTSSDRTPKVRIHREQSPSPGQVSPEHDSFYSNGSSEDEIVENEASQLNVKTSSKRSSEVSSASSSSKLKSKAENVKVLVEADSKIKDMAEEGKEISRILIEDAAKDVSNEKESEIQNDKENHSQSSDDSKNWSTEGNVRGDITKDKTAITEKTNAKEDNADCKNIENAKPPVTGFKSHFKALYMLRIALRTKASERTSNSSSSASESSDSSISETSNTGSQGTDDPKSESLVGSQGSLRNKTMSEKSEQGMKSSAVNVSNADASSAVSSKSEIEGQETPNGIQQSTTIPTSDQSGVTKFTSPDSQHSDNISEDVVDAILIIQAGYRGMKAREELRSMKRHRDSYPNPPKIIIEKHDTSGNSTSKSGTTDASNASQTSSCTSPSDNDIDNHMEITDEVIDAATHILAAFRGRQARKEVEKMKREMALKFENEATESEEESSEPSSEEESEEAETAEENNSVVNQATGIHEKEEILKATTTIQSGYRGMKARNEVKHIREEREDEGKIKRQEIAETIRNEPKLQQQQQEVDETLNDVSSHELSSDGSNRTANNTDSIDIDLEDAQVGDAVVTIQAGYRGHKARNDVRKKKEKQTEAAVAIQSGYRGYHTRKEAKEKSEKESAAATAIQSGYRGHKTRKEMKERKHPRQDTINEDNEEIDIDLDDPEVGNAALKIQSGFKGHQARKQVKEMKEQSKEGKSNNKMEIDVDLDDPEVGDAALKIQSGFRGHQARKHVNDMKKEQIENETENDINDEEIDIDLNDPEVGNAALKIQAGFKGHQARKQVTEMKERKLEVEEKVYDNPVGQEFQELFEGLDFEDEEIMNAIVGIQANMRGFIVRKQVKEKMKKVSKAAISIQAGFR